MQDRQFTVESGGPLLESCGRFGLGDVQTASRRGRLDGLRYDYPSIGAIVSGVGQYACAKGPVAATPGVIICGDGAEEFSFTYEGDEALRRVVIAFDPELIAETAAACDLPPTFPAPGIDRGDRQTRVYALLRRLARSGGADEEGTLEVLGLALGAPLPEPRRREHPRAAQLRTVAREINRDCMEPWDLAAMARSANMSRYHFVRAFSAVLGATPYQHLLGARLRLAADQLLDGGPITHVALNVGFNDISNFNHAFRRVFGASPRVWRGDGSKRSRPARLAA